MTVREAAEFAGISYSYMKALIKDRKIKAKKVKTKTNRFNYVWEVDKESVKQFKKLPHSKALGVSKKGK